MTQVQTTSTKKTSIILVDDEEDILTIFSQLLRKEGYHVYAFSNPVIALEHFRYSPTECSLLISDVRMQAMNGFQLARKVKELNPDVKVILTSAFEIKMNEFEKVLPNTQVDGFLEKPIRLKKLSELVKAQIKLDTNNA
jgi:DNA-binding NtrC family response regulator